MVGIILNPQTGIGEVNIPTLAADTAISVGFIGGDALAPFMNEIRKIFGKDLAEIRETTQDLKDNSKDLKDNSKDLNEEFAKESKKQIDKLKEMSDTIHKSNEENVKLSGIMKDSIDKDEKIFNAYGKTFLNLL